MIHAICRRCLRGAAWTELPGPVCRSASPIDKLAEHRRVKDVSSERGRCLEVEQLIFAVVTKMWLAFGAAGSFRGFEHRDEGGRCQRFLSADGVDVFKRKRDDFWPCMTDRQTAFDGPHCKINCKTSLGLMTDHLIMGWLVLSRFGAAPLIA